MFPFRLKVIGIAIGNQARYPSLFVAVTHSRLVHNTGLCQISNPLERSPFLVPDELPSRS